MRFFLVIFDGSPLASLFLCLNNLLMIDTSEDDLVFCFSAGATDHVVGELNDTLEKVEESELMDA